MSVCHHLEHFTHSKEDFSMTSATDNDRTQNLHPAVVIIEKFYSPLDLDCKLQIIILIPIWNKKHKRLSQYISVNCINVAYFS